MSKPCCGYPSVAAAVRGLLSEGHSVAQIAQMTGRSTHYVYASASRAGVPVGRAIGAKYGPLIDAVSLLQDHAEKRQMRPHMLAKRILIAAVEGDLIDAILDDGGSDE